jgi:DNA invertase Pin-like site-specific DNA recombinase
MTVFGYGRHSTSAQALTESVQRTAVNAYATAYLQRPAADEWLYDAAVSGGLPVFERPAGRKIWALAQPGDHIVTAKLDRMFRNTADGLQVIEMMEGKGIFFHCVNQKVDTFTAQGRAVLTVLLAFNQMEREQAGERTREALAVKREAGLPYGSGVPIGWKKFGSGKDSRFVPDEVERGQVAIMMDMRSCGESYDSIVSEMRRLVRPSGHQWNRNSVRKAIAAGEAEFPKAVRVTPQPS